MMTFTRGLGTDSIDVYGDYVPVETVPSDTSQYGIEDTVIPPSDSGGGSSYTDIQFPGGVNGAGYPVVINHTQSGSQFDLGSLLKNLFGIGAAVGSGVVAGASVPKTGQPVQKPVAINTAGQWFPGVPNTTILMGVAGLIAVAFIVKTTGGGMGD